MFSLGAELFRHDIKPTNNLDFESAAPHPIQPQHQMSTLQALCPKRLLSLEALPRQQMLYYSIQQLLAAAPAPSCTWFGVRKEAPPRGFVRNAKKSVCPVALGGPDFSRGRCALPRRVACCHTHSSDYARASLCYRGQQTTAARAQHTLQAELRSSETPN